MPTAVVTGSSKGIGLALCAALAARGWSVVGACRRASPELVALPVAVAAGAFRSLDPRAVTGS
jgi:NAD(P)-dependent dehydrogenase (short-subunit alcohol dehydrogenase family)